MPTGVYSVFTGRPVPRQGFLSRRRRLDLADLLHDSALFAPCRSARARGPLGLTRNLRRIKAVAYFDPRDPWPFLVSLKRWGWGIAKGVPSEVCAAVSAS